jgi:hypothetical protein
MLVVALGLAASDASAQNLLRNARFEGATAGDVPESWSFHDFRDDGLAHGRVVRGGNAGPQCLELKSPVFPANYACYSRPMNVGDLVGDEIIVSCFFKTAEHPQASVTIATYADDFTRLEFDTPELDSETYHLGESSRWTLFATHIRCKPRARDLVVMLRVNGGGTVCYDGVGVRPVDGEVAVSLDQAGVITGLPATRMLSLTLHNVTDGELPVRVNLEVIPEQGKRRTKIANTTLAPDQTRRLDLAYPFDYRQPHGLRVAVTGLEPDTIYQQYARPVAGLVDAHVVEPAFRSTLLSSIPTEDVVVEGRINASPEIARATVVTAQLVGTGATTSDLEFLSDEGMAGPWRLRLPAEGMLTDNYQVDIRATPRRGAEHLLSLPLSRSRFAAYEVAYDADHRLYVHGQPVFPMGMYRVPFAEDLPVVRDAGFNFVISPSRSVSYLFTKAARDAGMMVAVSSSAFDGKFWTNMTDKYRRDEALFGWYGIETPDTRGASPETVRQVYRQSPGPYKAVAEMDAHHPIILALRPNSTMRKFAESADIVVAWTAPIPRWPLTTVCDSVREAIATVEGRKPVWAAIQTTGLAWQEDLPPDDDTSVIPTVAQHRAMVYLALMSGAEGLVHYTWSVPPLRGRDSYRLSRDAPELWEGVKLVTQQVAWLSPVLMESRPTPMAAPEDSPLVMAAWDHEGVRYIAAVNPTDEVLALSFDLGAAANEEIEVLFEQRALEATADGRVGDAFQPYEVHLYARKL